MATSRATPAGPRRWWRAPATACLGLAVLLLPVLVAGSHIDAPPAAAELAHLQAALGAKDPTAAVGSEVARQFYVSMLPPGATLPDGGVGSEVVALVGRARLAQLVSLLGLSLLLYVAVLLARGRLQALLAVVALAGLPPIACEGHLLQPETPAAVFCLLAVVLLQCLAQPVLRRRRGRGLGRVVYLIGLALCATLSLGLAVATMPSCGEALLVPGVVLTIAAVQLGLRALGIIRRLGLLRLPIRSINRRLMPWTAASLLAPLLALWLLSVCVVVPVEAMSPSVSRVGLWPSAGWPRAGLAVLLGLGAIAGVLRIGLRFGRRGRIGPDLVLLVYCVVFLATAIGAETWEDRLPAAPAMAVGLSEGGRMALVLLRSAAVRVGWLRVERSLGPT